MATIVGLATLKKPHLEVPMPYAVEFTVGFCDVTLEVANQQAERLRQALLPKCGPEDKIEIIKASAHTQDAGSILAIGLANAPAVVEIARGISAYISGWGNALVVRTPEGEVVARGTAASSFDAAAVAEALNKLRANK